MQVPTVKDVPRSFNVTLLKDDGKIKPTSSVYSSKGIGEPAMAILIKVFYFNVHTIKKYLFTHYRMNLNSFFNIKT